MPISVGLLTVGYHLRLALRAQNPGTQRAHSAGCMIYVNFILLQCLTALQILPRQEFHRRP